MSKFHVIIPAAGSGSRMASETPKQYLPFLGGTLIEKTLSVFLTCPHIDSVSLVISADDNHWDALNISATQKLHVHRQGGNTRAETVLNGLRMLASASDDWVLVHDAARPGLSIALLEKLISELSDDPVGGLLAIPLADTLKRADNDQRVAHTEPRDHLWQAQTPQMFRYALLKEALENLTSHAPTDEAQAIEALGFKPKLVAGELRNLKITYPEDMALLEAVLKAD
ncbi:MAG: 2-C-methyl-D-erythritol 4-phosphate cytidylyltransferase [Methylophilaceae bacterium]